MSKLYQNNPKTSMVIPHLFCMDEIHVVQRICLQVLKKIALLLILGVSHLKPKFTYFCEIRIRQKKHLPSEGILKMLSAECRQFCSRFSMLIMLMWVIMIQVTGLDAKASRVKCPARFVSHLHEIFIYIWVVYSFCLFCCLFIIVTWWYMWCIVWQVASKRKYRHVW